MTATFDRGLLLYAIGLVFGALAVLYASVRVDALDVLALSPTVKAALFLLASVGLFVAGTAVERRGFSPVLYVLSVVSYLGFVSYVWYRFTPPQGEFLALVGVSALSFLGLGYTVRRTTVTLGRPAALTALVVIGVLAAGGVLVDVTGPQPTYTVVPGAELHLDSTTDVHEPVVIGTLVVENEFVLSRISAPPAYRACAYFIDGTRAPGEEYVIGSRSSNPDGSRPFDSVVRGGGRATRTLSLVPWVFAGVPWASLDEDSEVHEDFADGGPVPVEVADACPARTDGRKLVIAPGDA